MQYGSNINRSNASKSGIIMGTQISTPSFVNNRISRPQSISGAASVPKLDQNTLSSLQILNQAYSNPNSQHNASDFSKIPIIYNVVSSSPVQANTKSLSQFNTATGLFSTLFRAGQGVVNALGIGNAKSATQECKTTTCSTQSYPQRQVFSVNTKQQPESQIITTLPAAQAQRIAQQFTTNHEVRLAGTGISNSLVAGQMYQIELPNKDNCVAYKVWNGDKFEDPPEHLIPSVEHLTREYIKQKKAEDARVKIEPPKPQRNPPEERLPDCSYLLLCPNCGHLSANFLDCDSCNKHIPDKDLKWFRSRKGDQKLQRVLSKNAMTTASSLNTQFYSQSPDCRSMVATLGPKVTYQKEFTLLSGITAENKVQAEVLPKKSNLEEPETVTISDSDEEEPKAPTKTVSESKPTAPPDDSANQPAIKRPRLSIPSIEDSPHLLLLETEKIAVGSYVIGTNQYLRVSSDGFRFSVPDIIRNVAVCINIHLSDIQLYGISGHPDGYLDAENTEARKNFRPYIKILTTSGCGCRLRSAIKFRPNKPPWNDKQFDPGSKVEKQKYLVFFLTELVPSQVTKLKSLLSVGFRRNQRDVIDPAMYSEVDQHSFFRLFEESTKTSSDKDTEAAVANVVSTSRELRSLQSESRTDTDLSAAGASTETNQIKDRASCLPRGASGRLCVFPPPPARGAVEIHPSHVDCLRPGEFLNDVIVDFSALYSLSLARPEIRNRTHVFNSFFFSALTTDKKRTGALEDKTLPMAVRRHKRVTRWTRNVDIFSKDFVIIPINESSHWFVAIICYPALWLPEASQLNPDTPVRCHIPGREKDYDLSKNLSDLGSSKSKSEPSLISSTNQLECPISVTKSTEHSNEEIPKLPVIVNKVHDSGDIVLLNPSPEKTDVVCQRTVEIPIRFISAHQESQTHTGVLPIVVTSAKESNSDMETATVGHCQTPASQGTTSDLIVLDSEMPCLNTNTTVRFVQRSDSQITNASLDSDCEITNCLLPENQPKENTAPVQEVSPNPPSLVMESPDSAVLNRSLSDISFSTMPDISFYAEQSDTVMEADDNRDEQENTDSNVDLSQNDDDKPKEPVTQTESDASLKGDDSCNFFQDMDKSIPLPNVIKRPCTIVMDSLASATSQRAIIHRMLREYVFQERLSKYPDAPVVSLDKFTFPQKNPVVPQQANSSDCGVYVMKYIESFFQRPILDYSFTNLSGLVEWFSPEEATDKRDEIFSAICQLANEQNSGADEL